MNCLHDGVEFTINFVIPKPQNFIPGVLQCRVPQAIALPPIIHRVLSAVDLHNQSRATTLEINDVG